MFTENFAEENRGPRGASRDAAESEPNSDAGVRPNVGQANEQQEIRKNQPALIWRYVIEKIVGPASALVIGF